jgi:hypothetical protein
MLKNRFRASLRIVLGTFNRGEKIISTYSSIFNLVILFFLSPLREVTISTHKDILMQLKQYNLSTMLISEEREC